MSKRAFTWWNSARAEFQHGLSFNSVDGVSLHRVYMKEAELKLSTGWTQHGNSARADFSARDEIIKNSHVNTIFFHPGTRFDIGWHDEVVMGLISFFGANVFIVPLFCYLALLLCVDNLAPPHICGAEPLSNLNTGWNVHVNAKQISRHLQNSARAETQHGLSFLM